MFRPLHPFIKYGLFLTKVEVYGEGLPWGYNVNAEEDVIPNDLSKLLKTC